MPIHDGFKKKMQLKAKWVKFNKSNVRFTNQQQQISKSKVPANLAEVVVDNNYSKNQQLNETDMSSIVPSPRSNNTSSNQPISFHDLTRCTLIKMRDLKAKKDKLPDVDIDHVTATKYR